MSSTYGPNCGKRVIGHLADPDERKITDIEVTLIGQSQQAVYSHLQAVQILSNAGIPVTSTGQCSNRRHNSQCTSLDGIHSEAIEGIITLKRASGCHIIVTGGTESGHGSSSSPNARTHGNGWKLDIRKRGEDCITKYIKANFPKYSPNRWLSASGNIYYDGRNHWDIQYGNNNRGKRELDTSADSVLFERKITDIELNSLTHLIVNTLIIDKYMNISWRYPDTLKNTIEKARTSYPNLKLMVSAKGGWFADPVLLVKYASKDVPEMLSAFLKNTYQRNAICEKICQFLMENNLDGIEIQWNQKALSEREKKIYIAFLRELRGKLNALPRPQLLSIVAARDFDDFFLMNRSETEIVLELVDFVNVRTYDYFGTSHYWTGPPAPLFDSMPPGQDYSSEGKYVDWTMRYYGCRTNQLDKFNLVIPFYGYLWSSVDGFPLRIETGTIDDDSLWQYGMWRNATLGFKGTRWRWRDIDRFYNRSEYTIYDEKARAPYIYAPDYFFLGFENEQSIKAKMDYVKKFGIGGVTLYSIDYDDDDNSLLKVIMGTLDEMSCNQSAMPYNCTPLQDEECNNINGRCTIEHLCGKSENNTGNANNTNLIYLPRLGKCPSSIVDDIVCCVPQPHNLAQHGSSTLKRNYGNGNPELTVEYLAVKTPIFLFFSLVFFLWFLKIKWKRLKLKKRQYVTVTTSLSKNLSDCKKLDSLLVEMVDKQNFKTGHEGDVFEGILKGKYTEMPFQRVAIKICRKGIYKEEDLENEIRLLSQCSHKNIINFLGYYNADFGKQMNVTHIVTEFMDGGTLDDLCIKQKIPLTKILEILIQICDGMAYLAQKKFVHRDLTPQNCVCWRKKRESVTRANQ